MASHRRVKATSVECLPVSPPFSNFEYFENHFLDLPSVRRLFSLARSFGMQTLVIEDIPARGIIKNENEEIKKYVKDYRMGGLKRLSFWQAQFKQPRSLNSRQSKEVIGYAILKHDVAPSRNVNKWHVFEAVFRKYQHKHNCVPNPKEYTFVIGESDLSVPGVLYCQQNGLNKACAQVALRSLLSRRPSIKDISYEEINGLAACVHRASSFDPSEGLNVPQIRSVLEGFGVSFFDIDYTNQTDEFRETHPYQKYLYAGVESGAGALLGFLLSGPLANNHERHIIPFYGHTFNKDTWAPDADVSYFNIGAGIGYFPSDSWTSSFLGHDDNFGPNFCVPRLYIRPNKADYVLHTLAPNDKIETWTHDPDHYHEGRPTRAARVLFVCRGINHGPFAKFINADVRASIEFVDLFQRGTHELDMAFSEDQLRALVARTESLVRFLLLTSETAR